MKTLAAIATAAAIAFATPSHADFAPLSFLSSLVGGQPHVVAKVSIAQQTMDLTVVDGHGQPTTYTWKVSTGRTGFETPTGAFKPTWTDIDHTSDTYDNAPMPFAVFFTGGYAVHATEYVKHLGKPASHGCVRLLTENAKTFFKLVENYGMGATLISVVD